MDPHSPAYDSVEKPYQVTAIGVMILIGGIAALVVSIGLAANCLPLFWPGTYYSFILGVVACIKSAKLLGHEAYEASPPKGVAIMQIVNIINLDLLNCGLGIATLILLGNPEVKNYFRG